MATRWEESAGGTPSPLTLARDARVPVARRAAILSAWAVELADRELADREDGITRSPAEIRRDRELLAAVNSALEELEPQMNPAARGGLLGWFARLIGA